jgi:tetratricopeptide (TPR) repeat protein
MIALIVSPAARAEWWEARTSHFIIYSETNRADAEKFAVELERFDNAQRTLQNMPVPGPDVGDANRLTVFRTGDTDRVNYYLDTSGSGIAGIYFGRAGNPVSFVPARNKISTSKGIQSGARLEPIRVLFHEYTHHFMLANFNTTYPHWYREGFAELYSTIEFRPDGSFHVGNVPQDRGGDLDALPDLRLTRLFDHKVKLTGMEYYQSYSFGWLMSHYLNFEPSRAGQLQAWLKALNSGEDSLTAAKRIFGDLDKLQAELRRYKRGPFLGYDVKPVGYAEPKVAMRRLTAAEEAVMPGYMRSQRGVDRDEAKGVARDIAGAAAPYPDSLFAQLALAEAQLDARDYDAADAAADRAIAIAPDSSAAQYWKGAISLGRGDSDKTAYAKARPYFIRARHLDPLDPRPSIGYYLSYQQAGDAIPEPAIIALEEVFKYAAYDPTYRMLLGRQLLSEDKGDLAKGILAPLAYSGHDDGSKKDGPSIGDIVDLIDAGKLDEARAKMAEIFKKAKDEADGKKD